MVSCVGMEVQVCSVTMSRPTIWPITHILRIYLYHLAHPVAVSLAFAVFQEDLFSLSS
jgi:hypothetical protein